MIKRTVQQLLLRAGYRLIPATPESVDLPKIASNEMAAVRGVVADFCEANRQDGRPLNPRPKLDYLNADRLGLIVRIVEICEQNGVNLDGMEIADIGAGYGYLLRVIANRFPNAHLYGFEPNPQYKDLGQRMCPSAHFEQVGVSQVGGENRFDVIFITEVLEHLAAPSEAIDRTLAMCRPGGCVVATVPDGRIDTMHSGLRSEENDSYSGHINFWSPESWETFIGSTNNAKCTRTTKLGSSNLLGIIWR